MIHSCPVSIIKSEFSMFNRLKSVQDADSGLTPENWCARQPCRTIAFGSKKLVLTQPSSTIFVYTLGLLTVAVGVYFLMNRGTEVSRAWWGISLLAWGIGALLAGTSYQALAYHIKCAGRKTCAWTSWWEVSYLMVQQVSMSAMLIGIAYCCTVGPWRTLLVVYAAVIGISYIVLAFVGGILPSRKLITFELMVLVSAPSVLIGFILNSWRYYTLGTPMDLAYLGTWLLLFLSIFLYWLYDRLGLTEKLWKDGKGIWFSQNDVLHICLIFWVSYIALVLVPHIRDYPITLLAG